LPIVDESRGSIRADGRHVKIQPADVHGRFTTARRLVFLVLIGVYAALPWIHIAGHPAVFLDIPERRFYLFGASLNAQDLWLTVFVLLGAGLALLTITAVAGRMWCGWACPQTVFLEGVYRRVERWINGPREARVRRAAGAWTAGRVARGLATQASYLAISLVVAHVFLSYFVSLPEVFVMVRQSPSAHPEAFALVVALTGVMYGNFAWFREQTCVILCPYGRLQSVLVDQDSLVVGYDVRRGEPRGKAKAENVGDCVDCRRCIAVCPTGIDIREGLQLDCIACTACIDACDDIMDRLGRARGLIRYDSQRGLAGGGRRIFRPRLFAYAAVIVVAFGIAALAVRKRSPYEANVLRLAGAPPYVIDPTTKLERNSFELHLVNKRNVETTFHLSAEAPAGVEATFAMPLETVTLASMAAMHAPVFVTARHGGWRVKIHVTADGVPGERVVEAPVLGP
jgi:cytochrome c oxidase accessory protein FixG